MNVRIFSVLACLGLGASPGMATSHAPSPTGPVSARVEPVTLATFQSARTVFGKLTWKGGIKIISKDPRFGGFSGLALSRDGNRFVAVSDRAWWLKGRLTLKNGSLASAQSLTMAPLRTENRKKSSSWRDSESLAPWGIRGIDGPLLVGFERNERILSYRFGRAGTRARPSRVRSPGAISSGPFNRELEAIGRFYSGPRKNWMIAVSERNLDRQGDIRGWLWRGKKTLSWSLKRFEDYDITDLAIAPDGKTFFTLERSFNLPNLPGFAIRRFNLKDIKPGQTADGELMFAGRQPFFSIDNMEGIALHKAKNGKLQLTVISDDNYRRRLQSTLIFRFEVT